MKIFKQIIIILVVFFKTGTVLSENDLFNVNNILLEKNDKTSTNVLTDQAILKGFNQLITKILLKKDIEKLSDLEFLSIKQLVSYYQISNFFDKKKSKDMANFSVTFDKNKIHKLFYNKRILYSEIIDKELYILPILIRNNEIFIFNNNFFYKNWNKLNMKNLIDFILPLENIEIIDNISKNKNNLINLNLINLFKEYPNKNLALILIDDTNSNESKLYIKTIIQGKNISKSLNFKKKNLKNKFLYEKIILDSKNVLTNLIKSENLIDIRTPSFINVKVNLNQESNLVELNSRIKNIYLIENIYVQEFNKDHMNLRIKYLGKLEKIIDQLKKVNVNLKLIGDQWVIKTL
tara:strand:+ start:492 stop:1538 length:1047 start_codon:yes stop_codon:yes gene_type:complete